jgi:hypothetical protein
MLSQYKGLSCVKSEMVSHAPSAYSWAGMSGKAILFGKALIFFSTILVILPCPITTTCGKHRPKLHA